MSHCLVASKISTIPIRMMGLVMSKNILWPHSHNKTLELFRISSPTSFSNLLLHQKRLLIWNPGILSFCYILLVVVCCVHSTQDSTQLNLMVYRVTEPFPGCTSLGLRMEIVDGDGSCLFRSFQSFFPHKTHKQWRILIADGIQNRAEEEDTTTYWLNRGNSFLEERLTKPYKDWAEFMKAMRGNQWGYIDWTIEFCLQQQIAIISFDAAGHPTYCRHKATAKIKGTYFIFNQENSRGQ